MRDVPLSEMQVGITSFYLIQTMFYLLQSPNVYLTNRTVTLRWIADAQQRGD